MRNNPDCNPDNRCGKCVRDRASVARQATLEARRAARRTPDGRLACAECNQPKPVEEFMRLNHRQVRQMERCNECHRASKRLSKQSRKTMYECVTGCGVQVTRKGRRCMDCYRERMPAKVVRPKTVKTMYPCIDECGLMIETKDSRCKDCRRIRQDMIAAKSTYRSNLTKLTNTLRKGGIYGIMFIGTMDVWGLPYRCTRRKKDPNGVWIECGRPLMESGGCYECTTGIPNTLVTTRRRIVLDPAELEAKILEVA